VIPAAHIAAPIDAAEHAWALECLGAGDSLGEVASWSGRPRREWARHFHRAPRPAPIHPPACPLRKARDERIEQLLAKGLSYRLVAARMGETPGVVAGVARRWRARLAKAAHV
jgi:hypothetical protein